MGAGQLIAIVLRHLSLDSDGATHGTVDAIEFDEQRIASDLDDSPAMFVDSWVDQSAAEGPQPFERSDVIQPDQAAVTNHVGIDHGNQLPPAWCPSDQV